MSSAFKFLMGVFAFIFIWTVLILLLTAQLSLDGSAWTTDGVTSFKQWLPWMFISPLIIIMSLWFPLIHDRWWISTVLHVSLCIITLLIVGHMKTEIFKQWPDTDEKTTATPQYPGLAAPQSSNPPTESTHSGARTRQPTTPHNSETQVESTANASPLIKTLSRTAPLGLPLYISIVLLCSLFRYRQVVLERDKKALQLEAQLTKTQLDLLRSQLQPHFLFNTLNSISSLIHTSPDKADSMIIQLSSLLRSTLEQRDATFITLQQEVETLLSYLSIQSTRFGDRINIKKSIALHTENLPIPPMILLPLVENAVRYGVEKTSDTTTIEISSQLISTHLILTITDDGPGISQSNETGTGVGLPNTTSRLLSLYPDGSTHVSLTENNHGQTVASIKLPINP